MCVIGSFAQLAPVYLLSNAIAMFIIITKTTWHLTQPFLYAITGYNFSHNFNLTLICHWTACRPYFVKRGQPIKYQFYKWSKNVAPFYIWQKFWGVRFPPPPPNYLCYSWRWSDLFFTYHTATISWFPTRNSVLQKMSDTFCKTGATCWFPHWLLKAGPCY
jgi:hypothetical protein